jgi:hypothetical protein
MDARIHSETGRIFVTDSSLLYAEGEMKGKGKPIDQSTSQFATVSATVILKTSVVFDAAKVVSKALSLHICMCLEIHLEIALILAITLILRVSMRCM